MNWYELASSDEVQTKLEELLSLYNFASTDYVRTSYQYEPERRVKFPSQAYEIAEALWGEFGEE